jgi:hypothetical protein
MGREERGGARSLPLSRRNSTPFEIVDLASLSSRRERGKEIQNQSAERKKSPRKGQREDVSRRMPGQGGTSGEDLVTRSGRTLREEICENPMESKANLGLQSGVSRLEN